MTLLGRRNPQAQLRGAELEGGQAPIQIRPVREAEQQHHGTYQQHGPAHREQNMSPFTPPETALLPLGKTCADCFHAAHCVGLGFSTWHARACDFIPSRFREKQQRPEVKP